jgi:hypothetical protein
MALFESVALAAYAYFTGTTIGQTIFAAVVLTIVGVIGSRLGTPSSPQTPPNQARQSNQQQGDNDISQSPNQQQQQQQQQQNGQGVGQARRASSSQSQNSQNNSMNQGQQSEQYQDQYQIKQQDEEKYEEYDKYEHQIIVENQEESQYEESKQQQEEEGKDQDSSFYSYTSEKIVQDYKQELGQGQNNNNIIPKEFFQNKNFDEQSEIELQYQGNNEFLNQQGNQYNGQLQYLQEGDEEQQDQFNQNYYQNDIQIFPKQNQLHMQNDPQLYHNFQEQGQEFQEQQEEENQNQQYNNQDNNQNDIQIFPKQNQLHMQNDPQRYQGQQDNAKKYKPQFPNDKQQTQKFKQNKEMKLFFKNRKQLQDWTQDNGNNNIQQQGKFNSNDFSEYREEQQFQEEVRNYNNKRKPKPKQQEIPLENNVRLSLKLNEDGSIFTDGKKENWYIKFCTSGGNDYYLKVDKNEGVQSQDKSVELYTFDKNNTPIEHGSAKINDNIKKKIRNYLKQCKVHNFLMETNKSFPCKIDNATVTKGQDKKNPYILTYKVNEVDRVDGIIMLDDNRVDNDTNKANIIVDNVRYLKIPGEQSHYLKITPHAQYSDFEASNSRYGYQVYTLEYSNTENRQVLKPIACTVFAKQNTINSLLSRKSFTPVAPYEAEELMQQSISLMMQQGQEQEQEEDIQILNLITQPVQQVINNVQKETNQNKELNKIQQEFCIFEQEQDKVKLGTVKIIQVDTILDNIPKSQQKDGIYLFQITKEHYVKFIQQDDGRLTPSTLMGCPLHLNVYNENGSDTGKVIKLTIADITKIYKELGDKASYQNWIEGLGFNRYLSFDGTIQKQSPIANYDPSSHSITQTFVNDDKFQINGKDVCRFHHSYPIASILKGGQEQFMIHQNGAWGLIDKTDLKKHVVNIMVDLNINPDHNLTRTGGKKLLDHQYFEALEYKVKQSIKAVKTLKKPKDQDIIDCLCNNDIGIFPTENGGFKLHQFINKDITARMNMNSLMQGKNININLKMVTKELEKLEQKYKNSKKNAINDAKKLNNNSVTGLTKSWKSWFTTKIEAFEVYNNKNEVILCKNNNQFTIPHTNKKQKLTKLNLKMISQNVTLRDDGKIEITATKEQQPMNNLKQKLPLLNTTKNNNFQNNPVRDSEEIEIPFLKANNNFQNNPVRDSEEIEITVTKEQLQQQRQIPQEINQNNNIIQQQQRNDEALNNSDSLGEQQIDLQNFTNSQPPLIREPLIQEGEQKNITDSVGVKLVQTLVSKK